MWECMILAFKVFIGTILWWIVGLIIIGCIALISYLFIAYSDRSKKQNKPKYEGKPIVVEGGKKDE